MSALLYEIMNPSVCLATNDTPAVILSSRVVIDVVKSLVWELFVTYCCNWDVTISGAFCSFGFVCGERFFCSAMFQCLISVCCAHDKCLCVMAASILVLSSARARSSCAAAVASGPFCRYRVICSHCTRCLCV